jgi:hypothetical protein
MIHKSFVILLVDVEKRAKSMIDPDVIEQLHRCAVSWQTQPMRLSARMRTR